MSNAKQLERQVAAAFYGHFPRLRPAREAAIPAILGGQNVVLSSGTGSGKTEAVLAPLVSRFWRHVIEVNGLVILFITPTKALANDLAKRMEPRLDGSLMSGTSCSAPQSRLSSLSFPRTGRLTR